MKFEKISIRNFRNFENIEIGISNKNIFFGLNDIGKTNFLYAMRYVFDANRFESNLSQIFALSGLKTCNLVTYK